MKRDFINAALKKRPERVPVWFMRQAGRYLPEYRILREKYSMLELIKNPYLSARITLLPFKYFDLDAAILFSDLLLILFGFGVEFEYKEDGVRVRKGKVERFDCKKLRFIEEEIKIIKREIDVPLIGFAPAPFTLFSYLVEGEYRRDFPETRKLIYMDENFVLGFTRIISGGIEDFLKFQADSGCDAVILFDSWVSVLSPEVYFRKFFPFTQKIFESLEGKIRIYFSLSTGHLLEIIKEYTCEVIGIDWRIPLKFAIDFLGEKHAIQGNFDPAILFSDKKRIKEELDKIKEMRKNFYGFIFNLGHGVLPDTPLENLKFLIDEVHSWEIG